MTAKTTTTRTPARVERQLKAARPHILDHTPIHVVFTDEIGKHNAHPTDARLKRPNPINPRWHKATDPKTGEPHVIRVYVSDYRQQQDLEVAIRRRKAMPAAERLAFATGRRVGRNIYVDLLDVVHAIYRGCDCPGPQTPRAERDRHTNVMMDRINGRTEYRNYGDAAPLVLHLTDYAPAYIRNKSRARRTPHCLVRWAPAEMPDHTKPGTSTPILTGLRWAAPLDTVINALAHMATTAKWAAWHKVVCYKRRRHPQTWPDQVAAKYLPDDLREAIRNTAQVLMNLRCGYPSAASLPENLAPLTSKVPVLVREDARRLAHEAPHFALSMGGLVARMNKGALSEPDPVDVRRNAVALAAIDHQMDELAALLEGTAPPDLSTEAQPEWV